MRAQFQRVDPSRYVIYLGFVAIFAIFAVLLRDDGFATAGNLFNIVQQTAPVTVMAVGMVFVLTAGEIDLSIGSIVAISALLASVVLREWPWPLGVAAGLGAGHQLCCVLVSSQRGESPIESGRDREQILRI